MPLYEVTMKETTYQNVIVEAANEEEARYKADNALSEDGFGWDGTMTTEIESARILREDETLEEAQNYGAYITYELQVKYGL